MSLMRKKRSEERVENNSEGLVAVRQNDGSMKHITREDWAQLNEESAENGDDEGTGE